MSVNFAKACFCIVVFIIASSFSMYSIGQVWGIKKEQAIENIQYQQDELTLLRTSTGEFVILVQAILPFLPGTTAAYFVLHKLDKNQNLVWTQKYVPKEKASFGCWSGDLYREIKIKNQNSKN